MPTLQYPKNPNIDTAFVVQDDGTKNRALMIAPQDISTLELPSNPNSTKGYVTVDGKKQRVIMVADITGGGGGGLPDQTGQSGKFLTTDGTDASWSDKPLVNNATGTDAIGIGVIHTVSGQNSIGIGQNTRATRDNATAIGSSASAGGKGAVMVGGGSAYGESSLGLGRNTYIGNGCVSGIAIGCDAGVSASNAIQISSRTYGNGPNVLNSDANTFKVANANGNYEIMSADGTIPEARLADTTSATAGQALKLDSNGNAVWGNITTSPATAPTLVAADWSSNTQTITVQGVTATNTVIVSPIPTDAEDYATAGILCTGQATNALTFTCQTTPASDLQVNIVIM